MNYLTEELYQEIIKDIKNINGVKDVYSIESCDGFLNFCINIKENCSKYDIIDKIHDLSFKYGWDNIIPIAVWLYKDCQSSF